MKWKDLLICCLKSGFEFFNLRRNTWLSDCLIRSYCRYFWLQLIQNLIESVNLNVEIFERLLALPIFKLDLKLTDFPTVWCPQTADLRVQSSGWFIEFALQRLLQIRYRISHFVVGLFERHSSIKLFNSSQVELHLLNFLPVKCVVIVDKLLDFAIIPIASVLHLVFEKCDALV